MAVITLPTNFPLGVGSGMGQARYDLVSRSDPSGAEQARLFGPPRWTLRLVQPPAMTTAQAGAWLATVARLRGKVNHLAAGNPAQRAPRGTLRGAIVLAGAHALGATTLSIGGTATGTLLQGDLLQVGTGVGTSQLVMVVADVATDGVGAASVSIEPPLRTAFASGTSVTWDAPVAYFRTSNEATQWSYGPAAAVVTGMALDLLESWTS
jgi:hypothetical protein